MGVWRVGHNDRWKVTIFYNSEQEMLASENTSVGRMRNYRSLSLQLI